MSGHTSPGGKISILVTKTPHELAGPAAAQDEARTPTGNFLGRTMQYDDCFNRLVLRGTGLLGRCRRERVRTIFDNSCSARVVRQTRWG